MPCICALPYRRICLPACKVRPPSGVIRGVGQTRHRRTLPPSAQGEGRQTSMPWHANNRLDINSSPTSPPLWEQAPVNRLLLLSQSPPFTSCSLSKETRKLESTTLAKGARAPLVHSLNDTESAHRSLHPPECLHPNSDAASSTACVCYRYLESLDCPRARLSFLMSAACTWRPRPG